MAVTHYGIDYIQGIPKTPPAWPPASDYGPAWIRRSPEESLADYKGALDAGVFCMVGEFGCNNKTPHDLTLAWMEHCLKLWKANNLGWALWILCGRFGLLDSGRDDVAYEDYLGHRLDRKMLDMLRCYRPFTVHFCQVTE